MDNGNPLKICVVTPTFRRETLLRRFLGRIRRQTYPHWRLIVVHDGPNPATAAIVARSRASDPRIEYLETAAPAKDVGVTPRVAGMRHVLSGDPPDYFVFWDDDNSFALDALEKTAGALEAAGRPDLLVVAVNYQGRVVPPPGVAVASLAPGQLDTASLVARPDLGLAGYSEVLRRKTESPDLNVYACDFMVFDYIRGLTPPRRIAAAWDTLVGRHDGLRWGPHLRHLLGIPPLGLAGRPWFRALTLGMVKPR
jgi:glycosyltransferase involved in cell wall biosynthesis